MEALEGKVIELAYALDTFYFLVMERLSCGWQLGLPCWSLDGSEQKYG